MNSPNKDRLFSSLIWEVNPSAKKLVRWDLFWCDFNLFLDYWSVSSSLFPLVWIKLTCLSFPFPLPFLLLSFSWLQRPYKLYLRMMMSFTYKLLFSNFYMFIVIFKEINAILGGKLSAAEEEEVLPEFENLEIQVFVFATRKFCFVALIFPFPFIFLIILVHHHYYTLFKINTYFLE